MKEREGARKHKYVQKCLGSIDRAQELNKDSELIDGIGLLTDIFIFTCELIYHTFILRNGVESLIFIIS